MELPFGQTVYRLRAARIPDPYNPDAEVPSDWASPHVAIISEAYVERTSTALTRAESREQAMEAKSLFCGGDADIRKGDRIFVGVFTPSLVRDGVIPAGTVFEGFTYEVDGIPPSADVNPFTGWQPPREIPLRRYEG